MTWLRAALLAALAGLAPAAVAQGVTLPDYHYVELDNGIVFLLHESRDVPLIGLSAFIAGGAVTDPDDKAGLSSVLAGMLEKGAAERTAGEFAEAIDAVGGSLSASASLEGVSISGDFLARDAGLAMQLLADMLQAPTLDSGEFRKLVDRKVDLLRVAKDSSPYRIMDIYGAAWLFGDHAYGTPVGGDETSLANISHRDLLAYYSDYVGADRTVISIVGDFDASEMINVLDGMFRDWRAAGAPLPEIEPLESQEGRRVMLVDKPGATQSYFWIGNVGVARGFEQRAELDIANTLFGGRFGSLLVQELRVNAALTYGAWSALAPQSEPGFVAIGSFTKTETTVEAIDLALDVLARLHEAGFDDEAIQSGKSYILGQFPFELETAAQLADQLTELKAYDLDDSHINTYGAAVASAAGEDIRAVIADVYPQPENLVFVIIGDAELIRNDIAKYGPVTEMAITEPSFRP